jgi:hypothetical protein
MRRRRVREGAGEALGGVQQVDQHRVGLRLHADDAHADADAAHAGHVAEESVVEEIADAVTGQNDDDINDLDNLASTHVHTVHSKDRTRSRLFSSAARSAHPMAETAPLAWYERVASESAVGAAMLRQMRATVTSQDVEAPPPKAAVQKPRRPLRPATARHAQARPEDRDAMLQRVARERARAGLFLPVGPLRLPQNNALHSASVLADLSRSLESFE